MFYSLCQVACTAHQLFYCLQMTGRLAEAEEHSRRALNIRVAEYGPDDAHVRGS